MGADPARAETSTGVTAAADGAEPATAAAPVVAGWLTGAIPPASRRPIQRRGGGRSRAATGQRRGIPAGGVRQCALSRRQGRGRRRGSPARERRAACGHPADASGGVRRLRGRWNSAEPVLSANAIGITAAAEPTPVATAMPRHDPRNAHSRPSSLVICVERLPLTLCPDLAIAAHETGPPPNKWNLARGMEG